ncbi:MAG: hypoxanthine phosphoribosyltransferase [Halobacteriales archaeon]
MRTPPVDVRDRPPYSVEQFRVKAEYRSDLDAILVPEGEIESRIEGMADEISRTYREQDGAELYALCVLKGAMRFFGALTPRLDLDRPFSEGVVRADRYTGGDGGDLEAEIRWLEPELIAGKDILVVEDIIDEGYTLSTLLEQLETHDPNSVEVAVLFDKVARRKTDVDVEYTGFYIPDEFVVGFGLDYDERYRNLRHLGVLDPSVMDG